MTDVTPKAQELADEKGVDISTVQGSGKDGRVLVEDVEKVVEEREGASEAAAKEAEAAQERAEDSMEAEDPAKDAEVVGEVGGDPLVVSQPSPETSVEAFKAHPHVPVTEQSDVELKDFTDDELETVEGTPQAEAAEADEEDAEDAPADSGADNEPDEEAELGGPGSTDHILNRGLRERGFYVIPDARNPNALQGEDLEEEERLADERQADRDAQQEAQVDTSSSGEAPSDGESLRQAAPAVGELAGEEAPSADSDE
jgi:hypothetical protein